ncbi:hypothetical protein [Aquimarina aquimarini]|uniref:hypothetical protein n=1 Tax=Aquimarina aquimarini TaxID=1191734 RepID=UPI001F28E509|nr:hypothetical protein [Aquimarina aquimarini]
MRVNQIILFVLIVFFLNGCAVKIVPYKYSHIRKNYIILKENTLTKLNGKYQNTPIKDSEKDSNSIILHPINIDQLTLYNEIVNGKYPKDHEYKNKLDSIENSKSNYFVQLNLKTNTILEIKLFKNDTLFQKKEMTGKLRRGIFHLNDRSGGVPYTKRRLILLKNNNLLIDEVVIFHLEGLTIDLGIEHDLPIYYFYEFKKIVK